jgi:hypothetical protein
VLDNGIEISMGFDKSTWKLFMVAIIYAEFISVSHLELHW